MRKAKKWNKCETDYVACTTMFPKPLPKRFFAEARMITFEDQQFPVPIEAEKYLTIRYGDYMTPPPVEQRVRRHDFIAYWK